MTVRPRSGHRTASAAVLVIGGGALSVAAWVGGQHGLAVGLVVFYVVAAAIAYVWSGGRGDVAAIIRAGGDERQRSLDLQATAVSGLAMAVAAIVGAVVETARGNDIGGFGVICLVGGLAYVVALAVLRARS